MLEWLIKHPATIAFFLVFAIAIGSSVVAKYEMSRARELQSQLTTANATVTRMRSDQLTIKGIDDEYEKSRAYSDSVLAGVRMRQDVCVVPTAAATSGVDAGPAHAKSAGQHGVSAQWLMEQAATGERYRQQVIGLQEYVRRVCLGE